MRRILISLTLVLLITGTSPVISWAGELEDAQERVRKNPNDATGHLLLGHAYIRGGKSKSAIVSLEEAIRLGQGYDSYDSSAYEALSIAYSFLGQKQNALTILKKAIKIFPNDGNLHSSLGLNYLDLNQFEEAIASCNEAIKINPNNPKAHGPLGRAYQELGRNNKAIMHYKKALLIDPYDIYAGSYLNKLEHKVAEERLGHRRKLHA